MFILKVSQSHQWYEKHTFHQAWHQVHWSMEGRSKRWPWTPGQAAGHHAWHLESCAHHYINYISMSLQEHPCKSINRVLCANMFRHLPANPVGKCQEWPDGAQFEGAGAQHAALSCLVSALCFPRLLRSMAEWPCGRVRKVCPCWRRGKASIRRSLARRNLATWDSNGWQFGEKTKVCRWRLRRAVERRQSEWWGCEPLAIHMIYYVTTAYYSHQPVEALMFKMQNASF